MEGVCDWIRSCEDGRFPAPLVAGVAHYAVTDIHPFANGNGRTARLLSSAVLLTHGYLPGRLFCFDGYYARDKTAYLTALRSVRNNTLNMDAWLEYYLEGLAGEYERVQAEGEQLNRLGLAGSGPLQLEQSQQRALGALAVEGTREFSRSTYEAAARLKRSAAVDDLDDLIAKGILRRVDSGPRTRYRIVERGSGHGSRGRPRFWTEERILDELEQMCAERTSWPSVAEFKEAGKLGLYEALVRHGGAKFWADQVGMIAP